MNKLHQALLLTACAIWMAACGGSDPLDLRNDAPDIRISAPSNVGLNEEVVLDGSASRDEDGDIDEKTYVWSQDVNDELQVTLTFNSDKSTATFTTPESFMGVTDLHFTLTAKDMEGKSGSERVVVTLNGTPAYSVRGKVSVDSSTHLDSDINNPAATYKSNDTLAKAQAINNPSRVLGYVNKAGEGPNGRSQMNGDRRDFYKLSLLKNQTIEFTYFLGAEKNVGERTFYTNDLDLYLYQDNQKLVDVGLWGEIVEVYVEKNKKEKRETIFLRAPEDGNYIVEVYAGRGFGSYKLEVTDEIHQAKPGELSLSSNFVAGEIIVKKQSSFSLQSKRASKSMKGFNKIAGDSESLALYSINNKQKQKLGRKIKTSRKFSNNSQQEKLTTLNKIIELRERNDVVYAVPNYIRQAFSTKPNDPLYTKQWHYKQINLPKAWDISRGSPDVTVAVLDTGIHASHPDIQDQLQQYGYDFIKNYKNAGDDLLGFVYPPGYSSIDPDPTDASSGLSHGTHVAGTVMADSDNNAGVSGVSWNSSLMTVRVLGLLGGTDYDIIQGVLYSSGYDNDSGITLDPTQRADVINMSLGGPEYNQVFQDVITQARANNVIVIASAGNSGLEEAHYPASFKGVISVGATDKNNKITYYSTFHSSVDVVAPGGDISTGKDDGVLSLYADGESYNYAAINGTSMAAPHISGVVALMKSVYPQMTPADLDLWLEGGILTKDLGDFGHDDHYGYGLIDAYKALTIAKKAADGEEVYIPPRVEVKPRRLNYSYDFNELPFLVKALPNNKGEKLEVVSVTAEKSWLNLDTSQISKGYGIYNASIDRSKLEDKIYRNSITVTLKDAEGVERSIDIEVLVNNAPKIISLFSLLEVYLYDYYDLTAIRPAVYKADVKEIPSQPGSYSYNFKNIEEGKYDLLSAVDIDNDGLLSSIRFDPKGYPKDLSFGILNVVKDMDKVDFSINIRAGK